MDAITYDSNVNLDKLLMKGDMEKKVQGIVRNVLLKARNEISVKLQTVVGKSYPNSRGDLRNAYKAVKSSVYRRVLGGSVSILNKRRAGAMHLIERTRTLKEGQRGGNRRKRSERTTQLMSYQGADLGFVLRFLNSGTKQRGTRYGNRGSISGRGWFAQYGQPEMSKAMDELSRLIDEEINNAGL